MGTALLLIKYEYAEMPQGYVEKLMSFNRRVGNSKPSSHNWQNRKKLKPENCMARSDAIRSDE